MLIYIYVLVYMYKQAISMYHVFGDAIQQFKSFNNN